MTVGLKASLVGDAVQHPGRHLSRQPLSNPIVVEAFFYLCLERAETATEARE